MNESSKSCTMIGYSGGQDGFFLCLAKKKKNITLSHVISSALMSSFRLCISGDWFVVHKHVTLRALSITGLVTHPYIS